MMNSVLQLKMMELRALLYMKFMIILICEVYIYKV